MPPTIVTTQVSQNPDIFEVRDNGTLLGSVIRCPYEHDLRTYTVAGDLIGCFNDWHKAGDAIIAANRVATN
jgi:hypothetical protein